MKRTLYIGDVVRYRVNGNTDRAYHADVITTGIVSNSTSLHGSFGGSTDFLQTNKVAIFVNNVSSDSHTPSKRRAIMYLVGNSDSRFG